MNMDQIYKAADTGPTVDPAPTADPAPMVDPAPTADPAPMVDPAPPEFKQIKKNKSNSPRGRSSLRG